jgi:uncharacterized protein (DUF433 family)
VGCKALPEQRVVADSAVEFAAGQRRRCGARFDAELLEHMLEVLVHRAWAAELRATMRTDPKEHAMPTLDRITQQPDVMGGKACIRGMRVTVGMVVGQIGAGRSVDEVLADYPYLERDDILQALRYAAWRADEREVQLAGA